MLGEGKGFSKAKKGELEASETASVNANKMSKIDKTFFIVSPFDAFWDIFTFILAYIHAPFKGFYNSKYYLKE